MAKHLHNSKQKTILGLIQNPQKNFLYFPCFLFLVILGRNAVSRPILPVFLRVIDYDRGDRQNHHRADGYNPRRRSAQVDPVLLIGDLIGYGQLAVARLCLPELCALGRLTLHVCWNRTLTDLGSAECFRLTSTGQHACHQNGNDRDH